MRVGDLTVLGRAGRGSLPGRRHPGIPADRSSAACCATRSRRSTSSSATTFETFAGDATPFEEARHHLEGCLQMQVAGRARAALLAGARHRRRRGPAAARRLAGALGVRRRAVGRLPARLRAEPGIVVVSEKGGIRHSCDLGPCRSRTPPIPSSFSPITASTRTRVTSRWEPLRVASIRRLCWRGRAACCRRRHPRPSSFADGTLSAGGSAPHSWVSSAGARALTIPGVLRFATDQLTDEGLAAVSPIARPPGGHCPAL